WISYLAARARLPGPTRRLLRPAARRRTGLRFAGCLGGMSRGASSLPRLHRTTAPRRRANGGARRLGASRGLVGVDALQPFVRSAGEAPPRQARHGRPGVADRRSLPRRHRRSAGPSAAALVIEPTLKL